MAMTDDLEQARASLQMIHAMPYNAEAPPEALAGEVTPTSLHYVRSNFALPEHDGTLTIGGAVGSPTTLTLDDLRALPVVERAVTLECAGNGRLEMRPLPTGEPWGDYAVSTARWTGARLSDVLAQVQPDAAAVDVRFEGADHGPYHLHPILPQSDKGDLTFVRALPRRRRLRPGRGDPHRLRDERGAPAVRPRCPVPARRAPLVRGRVREVVAPDRCADLPVRRRVPDRPLHLRVARPPARAGHPDARAGPHHRPGTRRGARPGNPHRAREGVVGDRADHEGRDQLHRRRRMAHG